jgi:hypothetical protein
MYDKFDDASNDEVRPPDGSTPGSDYGVTGHGRFPKPLRRTLASLCNRQQDILAVT